MLLDEEVAGKDATEVFFSLHRHEVLTTARYARLQIGTIPGETAQIATPQAGDLSKVPYAEPTWLSEGFSSAYYNDSHRKLQGAMRKFVDEVLRPDAQEREEDGKRPSLDVIAKCAELNIHAMRMGPGKHLKGLSLMGGLIKPEEVCRMTCTFLQVLVLTMIL